MATYAQVSDVRALAPQLTIDSSTKPSDGDVQAFLDRDEAVLNAILSNLGYVTPIAGTAVAARLMVKEWLAHSALAKALRARGFGTDGDLVSQARDAQSIWDKALKDLQHPMSPLELPGVTRTDREVMKDQADVADGYVNDAGFSCESRVTRDQRF